MNLDQTQHSNGKTTHHASDKANNATQTNSDSEKESHMMRGALRALFAVGVVMVIFRLSRRSTKQKE